MKIVLTLHHFTLPKWFAEKGGFEKVRNVRYFIRFVRFVVEQYAELVDMWITFNEPGVYIWGGYDEGVWPPFKKKNRKLALKIYVNLALAHRRAYKIIHKADKSHNDGQTQVGIAQNTISFSAYQKHSLFDQVAAWFLDKTANHGFYILSSRKTHDFIGINYYFRVRLKRKPGTFKIIKSGIAAVTGSYLKLNFSDSLFQFSPPQTTVGWTFMSTIQRLRTHRSGGYKCPPSKGFDAPTRWT